MKVLFFSLLLCFPILAFAETGTEIVNFLDKSPAGFVTNTGKYIYVKEVRDFDETSPMDESLQQMKDRAKMDILQFMGSKVSRMFFLSGMFESLHAYQYYQSSLEIRVEGYITEFSVIKTDIVSNVNGGSRISIYAQATYEKVPGIRDPHFNLSVFISKLIYFEGEIPEIEISSDDDGFVSIFGIEESGKCETLFPAGTYRDNFLKAGQKLSLSEKNEKMRFKLPKKSDEAYMVLRVVINKTPFNTEKIKQFDDFAGEFAKIERNKFEFVDAGIKITRSSKSIR